MFHFNNETIFKINLRRIRMCIYNYALTIQMPHLSDDINCQNLKTALKLENDKKPN